MELLLEFVFDLYLELMMFIVPEEKATSRKYRVLAIIIASISLIGILALFIWGGVLVFERGNKLGIIPIVIAVILSLAQIIAGLAFHKDKPED